MDHIELGRQGELLARALLEKKGMRILACNYRSGHLEVDMLARDRDMLVVVEVKTRQTEAFGEPASFVDAGKQKHLADALESFLFEHPEHTAPVRYDVLSVVINSKRSTTEHIEDAFWPDNLGVKGMCG